MRSLLFALVLCLVACGEDDPAPAVTITAVTPESLAPDNDALDDLTITVQYDDADGDLGTGTAEVHDCRASDLVTALPIPAIAPDALGDAHITGELLLHVNDVGVISSAALPATCDELGVAELAGDEAVFCVILIDAAGHRGPGDCTVPILIE